MTKEDFQEDTRENEVALEMKDILSSDNIAELLNEKQSQEIASKVIEDFTNDKSSIHTRLQKWQKIIELMQLDIKDKTYPWAGASNIIFPLTTQACIEFASTCLPEILKDNEVVKIRVIGKDDGKQAKNIEGDPLFIDEGGQPTTEQTPVPYIQNQGAKLKKGQRVAMFMNYQLLNKIECWQEDIDKLLNSLPALGNMYKKIYYCPINDEIVSELIYPHKVIINYNAKSLKTAVITEVIDLTESEVLERIRSDYFLDFELEGDQENQSNPELTTNKNTNNKLHTFLEQYTWLDLDDDDFLEPYIITVHQNTSKVVRIVPYFEKEGIEKNKKGEIKKIKPLDIWEKFSFIPNSDGSFYSIGLGDLLFNLNNSINTSLNQMIDAGHLAIVGGGFIGKGMKMQAGSMRMNIGEYKFIDTVGDNLRNNIVPINHPEPSPVLFQLLVFLVDTGKNLGMMREVLSGNTGGGNIQATTYTGMVEQGLKSFKAIYKRLYLSLGKEYKKIFDLNKKYLNEEEYLKVVDEPVEKVSKDDDFDADSYDICPVSDIEMITSYQRMTKVSLYMQFMNDPYTNQEELRSRIYQIAQIKDPEKLITTPPPVQNPLLEIEQLRSQVKTMGYQIESQAQAIRARELEFKNEKVLAEIENINTQSMVNIANVGKINKETNLKEQTEGIKVMDNIIDANIREAEMRDKKEERQVKLGLEVAKMQHEKDLNNQSK